MEVARLYGDLDIRHYPSCAQVNNPTLQPTAPSTLLPLSPSPHGTIPWTYRNKANQPAPRRSRLRASSLLTTPKLVSLAVNQVCHIRLFSFALRIFSMKWSNRLCVFSFVPFRSFRAFFRLRRPLLLLCLSFHLPQEYHVISPSAAFPDSVAPQLRVLNLDLF